MNFKSKITTLLSGILLVLVGSAQADVLEWDFSKGINPLNSKIEFKLSKETENKNGVLRQLVVNRTTPGGIFSKEKYAELMAKVEVL